VPPKNYFQNCDQKKLKEKPTKKTGRSPLLMVFEWFLFTVDLLGAYYSIVVVGARIP